jgi:capsular polysaccharide biosynthesis protein
LSFLEIDLFISRIISRFFTKSNIQKETFDKDKPVSEKIEQVAKEPVSNRLSKFIITINMDSQFYQINLLQLLMKWKAHLFIIALAAIVLSAIFSGPAFITPKFKSYAVVYPANIASYSDENETEQMLQILQSKDISDSIIEKFNLPEHYGIDRNYKHFYSTLMWEYSKNVKISKTSYEGVSIEVQDKDPQIASDMIESMLHFYNQKVGSLHENKFGEVVRMYERAIIKKQSYIDSLKIRLGELGTQFGLLDYETQSEQVTKGYLRTIDGSGSSYVRDNRLEELKSNIEQKGGEVILLQNLINYEAEKFADLKYNYEKALMDYDRQFTYVNEITKSYPADKKSYPVRWLIVVISTLAASFLALLIILILENYRNLTIHKH